jgi:hypothetical protein
VALDRQTLFFSRLSVGALADVRAAERSCEPFEIFKGALAAENANQEIDERGTDGSDDCVHGANLPYPAAKLAPRNTQRSRRFSRAG